MKHTGFTTMLASTLFATTRCSAAFVSRGAAVRAFSRTSALAMANPTVFFDMEVGGQDVGRVTFELRADVAPKTGTYKRHDSITCGTVLTFPRSKNQRKTFVSFALVSKGLATKDQRFTVSFRNSCAKAGISPKEMEREAKAFTAKSSRMKTLRCAMKEKAFSRWPTLDRTVRTASHCTVGSSAICEISHPSRL
jgi:hypothetical protein